MNGMLNLLRAKARLFGRAKNANVAMLFALSLVPMTIAAGVGLDFARGMMVRASMTEALDAAALAVGGTTNKPSACNSAASGQSASCQSLQQLAQQYFSANYKPDKSYGAPAAVNVQVTATGAVVSATDSMPTTLLSAVGYESVPVSASSTVVWGQSKLWVALVLDNSGSMADNSKMTALKSASQQLLTTLQGASSNAGDVEVGIVPFTNDVNSGTGLCSSCIDWTNWGAQTTDTTNISTFGPGDDCPYSYGCRTPNTVSSSSSTIPSSGTYSGYICPKSYSSSSYTNGTNGHWFMGCFTSTALGTATVTSCSDYSSSNCTSTTKNGKKTYTTKTWTHVWKAETNHALWQGCLTDRTQDYDIQNTQPVGSTSGFAADNNDNCPDATITELGYGWASLSDQINDMQPAGSTNQAIGVAHGWQMLTPGNPYGTPSVPANTARYIILLSDGLNTQDRWYGNGMTESTALDANIDSREEKTCDAAKAAGIVIYTLFVNINNADGDSAPLLYCASDSSKFYELTSSSQISTAFADIAQQITNLRVSK